MKQKNPAQGPIRTGFNIAMSFYYKGLDEYS